MYKIIYIDEQPDDIDNFKDYVEGVNTKEGFEVKDLFPLPDIASMIEAILQENPDAIVTDFMLNEYKEKFNYNVPYNGVDLVKEFQAIRQNFPCFVLTSFDVEAIHESDDVNIVYIKKILHGGESQANIKFLERVEAQIKHYRTRLQEAERRLSELMSKKQAGSATVEDEEELIRLDQLLENSIDKKRSVPETLKTITNSERLDAILSKVDKLLKTVNEERDQAIQRKKPKKDL
ncbi:MAG TPA: hypothetical protein VG605_09245 [Puia sp.]|nr:hypothetical protein [Puia sp.]